MKRTILSLFSIMVLAMAGSVVAQTGTTTPTAADTGTPVLQQDAPPTQPAAPAGDPAAPPAAAQPSSAAGTMAPADAGQADDAGKLPATASNGPIMALLGALALGAFTVLLVVRRRGAARS